MKINLLKQRAHISVVNGYYKGLFGRYWIQYKSNAVWTTSVTLFFIPLN